MVEFAQEAPGVKDGAQGRELTAPDFMAVSPLARVSPRQHLRICIGRIRAAGSGEPPGAI